MKRSEMADVMERVFEEMRGLRRDGQAEYAHDESSAFANFERVARFLDGAPICRETVLLVYLFKHLDGIISWIKGHRSQRENVRGRLNDAGVYLCLLRGMIEETEAMDSLFQDCAPQDVQENPTDKIPVPMMDWPEPDDDGLPF